MFYVLLSLKQTRLSVDSDFRRDLASKICQLADRFAPSHTWYVRIINEVLELGGGTLVPSATSHNLLRLIAEGPTGNEDEDEQFRREVVTGYIDSISRNYEIIPEPLLKVGAPSLPHQLLRVRLGWVLGHWRVRSVKYASQLWHPRSTH